MDSTQNPLFGLLIINLIWLIGIHPHLSSITSHHHYQHQHPQLLTTHIISVGSIVSCGGGGCIWGRGGGVGWGGGAIGSCNYQFLRIRFSPILEVAMMSAISPVQMVCFEQGVMRWTWWTWLAVDLVEYLQGRRSQLQGRRSQNQRRQLRRESRRKGTRRLKIWGSLDMPW